MISKAQEIKNNIIIISLSINPTSTAFFLMDVIIRLIFAGFTVPITNHDKVTEIKLPRHFLKYTSNYAIKTNI